MRRLLSLLIFSVPLISYADTDEVPLEEEPDLTPFKRSLTPSSPKLFITDCVEIKAVGLDSSVPATLKVWDSFGTLVYNQTAPGIYYLPTTLQEGEVYAISLYVGNLHYNATYKP